MSRAVDSIYEQLSDDIISHGWLVQCALDDPSGADWKAVLAELLTRDVEIGTAAAADAHVEFTAWRGVVDDRLSRAIQRVESFAGRPDCNFAYWLALRTNVDRFEGN